eukprot:jgi/Psemu1/41151/gm1.41151_g
MAVLKRFQDGNFHGTGPFDVAGGILPLAFTPPGWISRDLKEGTRSSRQCGRLQHYDLHRRQLPHLEGLPLELQKTKAYILVDWTEATTQLESYLAVLTTILGINHDVVTSYQQGLWQLKIQQMPLQRAIADEIGELLTPVIVVYYFQIRVRGWLEEHWESAFTIPFPDLGDDFHTFQMSQNLNWLPNVSNVATPRLLRRPDPPQAPNNAGSYGNINNNSNNHSSSPGVRTSSGTPAQTCLANPNRDPHLKDSTHPIVKKLEASKMREAMQQAMRDNGKGPLSRSDGRERCHSWHIKGVCFSSCKHLVYDHMTITSSEQDQLWQWCQEVYA